ncbi:unnamed protein product [Discosporangium mesarthrocarpum]
MCFATQGAGNQARIEIGEVKRVFGMNDQGRFWHRKKVMPLAVSLRSHYRDVTTFLQLSWVRVLRVFSDCIVFCQLLPTSDDVAGGLFVGLFVQPLPPSNRSLMVKEL